jgi:Short C-terminal domain
MRYWISVLGGFALATASLVAGAWGLYHLTRTGTCASGGPYVSARPCPPGTGGHVVSLIAGVFGVLIAGGIYAARGGDDDHRRGRIGFGVMLWTLGFLMLAGGALLGAYGPANTGGSKLGAIIVAGIFVPMALVPLLWALFSGSDDEDPSPAPAIQPHAFGAPPAARYPSVFVSTAARPANGNGDESLDQLEKLAKLHADGALTDAEFAAAKAKVLSRS